MPYRDRDKQRAVQQRHYENNKPAYKERAKLGRRKARAAIHAFIREYLTAHPCVDCGETDPVVLEFDHRGDKEFSIGAATHLLFSLDRVKAEIAKCDVRCANCHRRKTYRERGFSHRD